MCAGKGFPDVYFFHGVDLAITLTRSTASLIAGRNLDQSSSLASKSFERLSSGLRINRAGDDAAGLALSSSLATDSRVFTQGIRNINDAVSLINIAGGALDQLSSITIRQRELATQSANGSFSGAQRHALFLESKALTDEFNRIIGSVEFNDLRLLDPNFTSLLVQTGYGLNGSIGLGFNESLGHNVGTGTFAPVSAIANSGSAWGISAGDVDHNGTTDVVIGGSGAGFFQYYSGNGDGTFLAPTSWTGNSNPRQADLVDVNNDGNLDVITGGNGGQYHVSLGFGNGTFSTSISYTLPQTASDLKVIDVTNDGKVDLVYVNNSASVPYLAVGNGDGTFSVSNALDAIVGSTVDVGDLNGDGYFDIVTSSVLGLGTSVLLGQRSGGFTRTDYANDGRVQVGDFNRDGYSDVALSSSPTGTISIRLANSDGTLRQQSDYTDTVSGSSNYLRTVDLNGDGVLDLFNGHSAGNIVSTLIGNSDGTFAAAVSSSAANLAREFAFGDFNSDGAVDFATGTSGATFTVGFGVGQRRTIMPYFDITTRQGALDAIEAVTEVQDRVLGEIGKLGSSESRLSIALNNLEATRESYTSANQRIVSADVAEEAAKLVRSQILQQVGVAILAQANSTPQLALKLINDLPDRRRA